MAVVKLLRVLQDGSYRRIGDEKELQVDVRIICTTQKDLGKLMQDGLFREDLFYRLNVLSLVLPPLRERKSDIITLAERFIKQHSVILGRKTPKMSKSCLDYLQVYPWPGNVRALRHAIERAIILSESKQLSPNDFQLNHATKPKIPSEPIPTQLSKETTELNLDKVEKSVIDKALKQYRYNISHTAKALGLTRAALYRRMDKHGL